MLSHHIILKLSGFLLIWLVGVTGLFGYAIKYNCWAQDSAIPIKDPDVAAIHFSPVEDKHSPMIDFAELDYQHPLTLAQRLSLTSEVLQNLSQEHLDQLYARLTAGSLPDGEFQGEAFLPQHHRKHLTRVWQILGLVVSSQTENIYRRLEGRWMELWQGKVFDRQKKFLQNRVDLKLAHDIAPLMGEQFTHALRTLPKDALLFPAKMYCGQSKLDSRRESIILDYAYNDDLQQYYRKGIDKIVDRNGLHIRDEIRMIHPGLYLGRVYLGKVFLVNFMVMNAKLTKIWEEQVMERERSSTTQTSFQEDCWTGASYNK